MLKVLHNWLRETRRLALQKCVLRALCLCLLFVGLGVGFGHPWSPSCRREAAGARQGRAERAGGCGCGCRCGCRCTAVGRGGLGSNNQPQARFTRPASESSVSEVDCGHLLHSAAGPGGAGGRLRSRGGWRDRLRSNRRARPRLARNRPPQRQLLPVCAGHDREAH